MNFNAFSPPGLRALNLRQVRKFGWASALCLVLTGCSDDGAEVAATEPPVTVPVIVPVPAQPAKVTTLLEFPSLIRLSEGAAPLQLTIPVTRADDNTDTLQLLISQDFREQYPALNIEFVPDTLPPGVDQFQLRLSYALSVAPVKPLDIMIPVQITGSSDLSQQLLSVKVAPTTAPDVYLLLGQSNMSGASQHGTKASLAGEPDAPDARIQQLNVTDNEPSTFNSLAAFSDPAKNIGSPSIITAQDPLHDLLGVNQNVKSGDQISPALSFAKAALANTDSTIVLVPAAWGGSAFCASKNNLASWNTGESSDAALGGTGLYHRAITRTDIALNQTSGILRGILWHQGESDALTDHCANQYAQNLVQLVRALRENIASDARGTQARGVNSDIPFIVGTMATGADERGDFSIFSTAQQTVDNVHRSIGELAGHASFTNNDDLIPPAYPCGDTSCIHFGATAVREMGQRYYRALQEVIEP